MRVCVVYDCLYPYTVGGAERWYRNLSERLVEEGHEVTYLTLRQWPRDETARINKVSVVTVGPRLSLYSGGRRRIAPPLLFGFGVFLHLLLRGGRYQVVHTASFPYFSLLAAGLVRPLRRFRVVVDWHELWTRAYWRDYLGPIGGRIGWFVQRLCLAVPQLAFCFSRLYAERLRTEGVRGAVTVLEGQYQGPTDLPREAAEPVIVFAGRHIPEKRVNALIPALARARHEVPGLRAEIYGDGPDRRKLLESIAAQRLEEVVEAPGFVSGRLIEESLARALCLVLPSSREGYGLVVLEAAARGTPSVVVSGPDNAATELVTEGENGFVVPSPAPGDLADGIVAVHRAGEAIRDSTATWFRRNLPRLALSTSLKVVLSSYRDLSGEARG